MSLTTDIGWVKTAKLLHYGVKGMRWGVRRSTPTTSVTVTQKGKKLKVQGGEGRPASPEAIRAREIGQIRKKSGVAALSNKDLQEYQTRLNLEQNVKRLDFNQKNAGQRFVLGLVGNAGKNSAQQVANEAVARKVKKVVFKGAVAAAI